MLGGARIFLTAVAVASPVFKISCESVVALYNSTA